MIKPWDILGYNSRYLEYIKKYNSGAKMALADDKLKTKRFLEARGIRVPKLLETFDNEQKISTEVIAKLPSNIVIKPNNGSRGQGIVVLCRKTKEGFEKLDGEVMTFQEISSHIRSIINGVYSMKAHNDIALIEKRIEAHDSLKSIVYKGLPDIRVIVCNLVPVIAMLRIPTAESSGKANMDAGAVGAGIDMAKGTITYLARYNKTIKELPGFGSISGMKIPFWNEILHIASTCQQLTGIGFLGVDIVIDKNGPMLMELNARPGLKIQIANLVPLKGRLRRIEGLKVSSPKHGVEISKNLFGHKLDRDIKQLSGKTIIGNKEYIALSFRNETKLLKAKINPLLSENILSSQIFDIQSKKYTSLLSTEQALTLKYQLLDKKGKSLFIRGDLEEGTDVILGKKELKGLLIDPYKYKLGDSPTLPNEQSDQSHERLDSYDKKIWQEIDLSLFKIEQQFSKHFSLFPNNYQTEFNEYQRKKGEYNPQFEYKQNDDSYLDLMHDLERLVISEDHPQGILFARKRDELLLKLEMFSYIGKDAKKFTELSKALYVEVDHELLSKAKQIVAKYNMVKHNLSREEMHDEELKTEILKYLAKHDIKNYSIILRNTGSSRMSIGKSSKKNIYIIKGSKVHRDSVPGLLTHEIGTHVLRKENSHLHPYKIFSTGTAKYLETEEGLAIYNQSKFTDEETQKNYTPALTYVKTAEILDSSFADAKDLESLRSFFKKDVINQHILTLMFKKIFRTKRGIANTKEIGGYTKDLIYFSGLELIENFVQDGRNLKELYIGKVGVGDLPFIENIKEVKPATYLPIFYDIDDSI